MNWIALMGAGALLSAGANVLDKRLIGRATVAPLACVASFGVISLPLAGIGLLLAPMPRWDAALAALFAGMIYMVAVWRYYTLLTHVDISVVVPLLRLSTVQLLFAGLFFLGERLTFRQLAACVLLLVSATLLSAPPQAAQGAGRRAKAGVHTLRLVLPILLSLAPVTTLLALNSLLMDVAYRAASLWQGQVWQALGMALGLIPLSVWAWSKRRPWGKMADRRSWVALLSEQTVRSLTGLAPSWAMTQRVPIALISAANGVTPLCVWLLAMVLLGERTQGRALWLRGCGMAGVMLALLLLATP